MRPVINQKEISHFLENFSIGTLLDFQNIKKGLANEIVKIKTTKGTYILKIIIRNSPQKVQYEINLLNSIKELPVPQPILSTNGSFLVKYNQRFHAFLYGYIKGKEYNKFSEKQLKSVGDLLAKFHDRTESFKSDIKRLEFYTIDESLYTNMIEVLKMSKEPRIVKELGYMQENFLKYNNISQDLPQGAIHSDFKPENILFEKEKISGVIDFDNAYQGALVLDLACTIMWFCSDSATFNYINAKHILDAYQKIRPLSKLEKNNFHIVLHYLMISLSLIVSYMHTAKDPKPYTIPDKPLPYDFVEHVFDNILETEKNLKDNKIFSIL